MHIPYVQNKVRQLVVEQLQGMLDVPLSVGNIEVTWLHRLIVDDLYLADQKNQPMLAVDRLAGDLDLYPLLVNKQIALNTVRLYGLDLHLSKETPVSPLNCQFVLDAFASKDTLKKKSIFNLIFRSIQIRKGQFYYDVKNKPIKENHFDTSHIGIQDLSGRISIKALKNDSLLAELKDLTLKERSGIEIKNMKFMAVGNLDSVKVKDFSLEMPHTLLTIKKAALTHLQQDSNKVDLGKAVVYLDITPSQVGLKDISPFIPALANFTDILRLKAKASGTIDHIVLDKLSLYRKDRFNFNGEMDLMHITNPDSTSVDGSVTDLTFTSEGVRWLMNNFSVKDLELPKPILRLGDVNFKGNIKGQLADLNATGQLVTDVGGVNADLHFGKNLEGTTFLRGHVYSVGVDLHSLLEPKNPFGRISFDLLVDMMKNKGQTFIGDVMGKVYGFDYKNYTYSDLTLMLNYRDDGINGQLELDDPNGQLMVDGLFVNKGPHSLVNFIVNVSHFRPDRLNLTQKYINPDFSGNIEANFEGNHVDNMIGTIALKDVDFKTDLDSFYVKSLQVKAGGKGEERSLLVKSDLLNGAVEGNYSFARIVPNAIRTLRQYVPALLHTKATMPITDNSFSFIFDINDVQDIANTLQLPVSINKPGQIKGYYNEQHSKVDLTADFPSLRLGKGKYENLRIECQNRENQLEANIVVTKLDTKKHRDNTLGIQASVKDDKLMANLDWSNSNKEHEFKGKFSGSAVFVREKDEKGKESLRTEVNIDRTPFVINDSIWHVAPSAITIQGTNYLVDHFKIASGGRFLSLNGIVSKDDPEAQLEVDLNKIQLAYVFDILGIPILQFSGEATGSIKASDLFGERIITSLLIANHFGFNQAEVGRLELNAQWVDDIGGILMMGSIYNDKGVWSDVNGYVYPVGKNSGLSLYFDAHDMNIRIAQPFVQNILKDIKGTGTGKIHLYGQPFSQITVDGDLAIKGGGAGIDFTQTYYNFDDTIHLKPDNIQLNGFTIRDAYGNMGKLDLDLRHNHFKDLHYSAKLLTDNLLIYNTTRKHMPMIYGQVFGNGTGTMLGTSKRVDFDINMKSMPNTDIYFDFLSEGSTANDYNFITYAKKDSSSQTEKSNKEKTDLLHDEGTEINFNCMVDVTSDAKANLIMDRSSGDVISGNVTGDIKLHWGTKDDIKMYGELTTVQGIYNFSMQQLIYRDFKIREGGTISFNGDPMDANLNLDGIYNVTANLNDLDETLAEQSPRTSVPVNCVLSLNGAMQHPKVGFTLELPSSDTELQQEVRSLIDTDDMMMRQVVYLLVLKKFYTPDYANATYRTSEFSALASSAISGQLSGILNSLTDKVQIGTNIRAGSDLQGFTDTEVEMLLSSQLLDNRLLFNGNFGYKNNVLQKSAFIGEFDLEYKLNRSGEFRLKAFNHANEMYRYLKQALTTQGVGIRFTKDFDALGDFFHRPHFNLFSNTPKPTPKDSVVIEDKNKTKALVDE